ncbi:MAG: amidohydrolase family protein [Acidobacteriota bacterium]
MLNKIRSSIKPNEVIDAHVHIGGPPGEDEEMFYWSSDFTKSLSFEGIKLVTKLRPSRVNSIKYVNVLREQIRNSENVSKAVLLALDEVYSDAQKIIKDETHLYVSNKYVAYLAQIYKEFLFGCSVHPYAQDALERLWHCAASGAVLCKWLPSAQQIDPTHPLSEKFYRGLALLKLPLLIHVGPEETIPTSLNEDKEILFNSGTGEYGKNPGDGIRLAVDIGATVIIAHCGAPLGPFFRRKSKYWEETYQKIVDKLLRKMPRRLYADISAFCLPGRFKYVKKIIPLAHENPGHFLYGSDYPIPAISFRDGNALEEIMNAFGWLAQRTLPADDLDKNFNLLQSHFPAETFIRASKILRNPQKRPLSLESYLNKLDIRKKKFFWFKLLSDRIRSSK